MTDRRHTLHMAELVAVEAAVWSRAYSAAYAVGFTKAMSESRSSLESNLEGARTIARALAAHAVEDWRAWEDGPAEPAPAPSAGSPFR